MNQRRKIVIWTQSCLLLNAVEPNFIGSKLLIEEIIAFIYSVCLMQLPREPEVSVQAFGKRKGIL